MYDITTIIILHLLKDHEVTFVTVNHRTSDIIHRIEDKGVQTSDHKN